MAESGASLSREDMIRPDRSGMNEGVIFHGARAMGGPLMWVDDPQEGSSALNYDSAKYKPGDLVRVATVRGLTDSGNIGLGGDVTQPTENGGGTISQTVGQTCAVIPVGMDSSVNCGARTAQIHNENPKVHRFGGENWPFGVERDQASLNTVRVGHYQDNRAGWEDLTVTNTSGSATMQYLHGNSETLTNQIITENPVDVGDNSSGSPALTPDGKLAGLFIANRDSDGSGVVSPIQSVEEALGARAVSGLRFQPLRGV